MINTQCVVALAVVLCVGCSAAVDDDTMNEGVDPGAVEVELEECPAGSGQSPIDLPTDMSKTDLDDLAVDYHESHVSMTNTGATVQYSYDAGSAVMVGSSRYDLIQFHFHAHSEHAFGGKYHPMEMHLVHRNAEGKILVLGILIEAGQHNPMFDLADWPELPTTGSIDIPEHVFNVHDVVPDGPTYRYTGSLTAPPCTSGVSWAVFQKTLTMDATQIEIFTHLYAKNFRPVQPIDTHGLVFGE